MKLFFVLSLSLFTLVSFGKVNPKRFSYLDKWISTKKINVEVLKEKQSYQVFRRFIITGKNIYPVADIFQNELYPKDLPSNFSIKEFVKGMDKGLGVQKWKVRTKGNFVIYEGQNYREGKLKRILFHRSKSKISYSVANFRTGYRSFLFNETLEVQKLIALNSNPSNKFKKKTVKLYNYFRKIAFITTAHAQSDLDGINNANEIFGDLNPAEIKEMFEGLKSLALLGNSLGGIDAEGLKSLGAVGSALGGVDPKNIQGIINGLGQAGEVFSKLSTGLNALSNSSVFKFVEKNPLIGSMAISVGAKTFNKITALVADGIVNGVTSGASALLGLISGSTKRKNNEKFYKNFNEAKQMYDKTSSALNAQTRLLNKYLDSFDHIISSGVSLEDYLKDSAKLRKLALSQGHSKTAKILKDIDYYEWLSKAKPIKYSPESLDIQSFVELAPIGTVLEICKDEVSNENFLSEVNASIGRSLSYYKGVNLDSVAAKEAERLTKLKESSEITEEKVLFKPEIIDTLKQTIACKDKLKAYYSKKEEADLKDEYTKQVLAQKDAINCKLPKLKNEFDELSEILGFYKKLEKNQIESGVDANSLCKDFNSLISSIITAESNLDKFRQQISNSFVGASDYRNYLNKQSKPIPMNKNNSQNYKNEIKNYKLKLKNFSKSLGSKRLGLIKKSCEQKKANGCSEFIDKVAKLTSAYEDFYNLDKENKDKNLINTLYSDIKTMVSSDVNKSALFRILEKDYIKYEKTLNSTARLVRKAKAKKGNVDIRSGEATSDFIKSLMEKDLEKFLTKVEADRTGFIEVFDGENLSYLDNKDGPLKRLEAVEANKEKVKILCGE